MRDPPPTLHKGRGRLRATRPTPPGEHRARPKDPVMRSLDRLDNLPTRTPIRRPKHNARVRRLDVHRTVR